MNAHMQSRRHCSHPFTPPFSLTCHPNLSPFCVICRLSSLYRVIDYIFVLGHVIKRHFKDQIDKLSLKRHFIDREILKLQLKSVSESCPDINEHDLFPIDEYETFFVS